MSQTAICYDEFNLRHHLSGHPENRDRLRSTWSLLQADGILDALLVIPSPPASDEQLLRVHTARHLERVAQAARHERHLDPDTYTNRYSEQAARLAAGGLCRVVDAVLTGQASNGFALIRPPGHHAMPERAMGFCLYNNIAVAARHAQAVHGIERVLIVDFDVHHGNGTQAAFEQDSSVLFFSTHQYPFYPGSGHWRETGRGNIINVPFPAGVGDEGYAAAFDRVLAPLARRFQPELILLSAGYDAHWNDPLAGMNLSIPGYAALVHRVLDLAGELCAGRLVGVLEGGYHLEMLAHSILNTLRQLSGYSPEISDPLGPSPWPERAVDDLLAQVRSVHP